MSLPKISIVTPSFNQGEFIEETILSVINQDYPNIEYIIIDGGSTDNTVEIIKKYEKKLAYWVSEKDSGQSEAINKGFKRATGDIVCWINSDDILMPGAIDKVVKHFENDQDLDFLNGYTLLIDINSNILFNYFILKQNKWYAKHGVYYLSQPSMFWKRHVFDTIGYLREDFHALMDKELLIRIFRSNFKIGHVEKILSAFRIHEGSKTGLKGKIWRNDSIQLYKLYGKEYGQNPNLVYKMIYGLEKLFKGLYFKSFLFRLEWNGKNIKELKYNNCSYSK